MERDDLLRRLVEASPGDGGPALRLVDALKKAGRLDEALAEGRGVVWVTGHVGNWELLAAGLLFAALVLTFTRAALVAAGVLSIVRANSRAAQPRAQGPTGMPPP